MSAQARVLNNGQLAAQEPDLIDRIAQALPEEAAGRLLPRDGALPHTA